ncbi:MAG: phosphopantetheine-binding protein [Chthoniobacter sp.]|uniref:acyl carrier protein n=1 Tax=Chthoniobacter sp. TaxID=2510640 RepID=UPI0032A51E0B
MNTQDESAIRAKIREFILSSIQLPDLADDDNLFESGIVNSLFAVELMTFLEKAFGIEVTQDDLEITNFQSIASAAAFVLRKAPQTSAI